MSFQSPSRIALYGQMPGPGEGQSLIHPPSDFLQRQPQVFGAKGNFRADRALEELLIRVLESIGHAASELRHRFGRRVPVADHHAPQAGLEQPIQLLDQCRFSGAVLTDDGQALAGPN